MPRMQVEGERKGKGASPCIVSVVIPLVVGGVSALLTIGAMRQFAAFRQPPLSPPAWLFPVVWTGLYVLMGLSSYRVWRVQGGTAETRRNRRLALTVYGIQLFFNFCWPLLFFRLGMYWLAFAWLLGMWALVMVLLLLTRKLDIVATALLIPYLVWVSFAAYLNVAIAILN